MYLGRTHNTAVLGCEGLCSQHTSICSDIPTGEQTARKVRRARGLRGRVQVRVTRQQLHEPWHLDTRHAASAHVSGPVSIPCSGHTLMIQPRTVAIATHCVTETQ